LLREQLSLQEQCNQQSLKACELKMSSAKAKAENTKAQLENVCNAPCGKNKTGWIFSQRIKRGWNAVNMGWKTIFIKKDLHAFPFSVQTYTFQTASTIWKKHLSVANQYEMHINVI
jgi:hypothetical protein